MRKTCPPLPTNAKKYISDLGKILVENHGKKKFYKPKEIKQAHKKSKWYNGIDFSCWGMSTYSSHADFDKHHQSTGEICDYGTMKTEMINAISGTESTSWVELPDFDIDMSWLDMGDFFDGILEGIGEFFGSILDAI